MNEVIDVIFEPTGEKLQLPLSSVTDTYLDEVYWTVEDKLGTPYIVPSEEDFRKAIQVLELKIAEATVEPLPTPAVPWWRRFINRFRR